MPTADNAVVDRLADRGWVDRWGFLLFAVGGAAAILVAKRSGLNPVLVATAAAVVMLAYAGIVQFSGTGRLRGDQAGDNCYYLGLIYTLTSLAHAIFIFDPANSASTIIQGFGIALATTIMGLILRVFFNQSRVDLVETEDAARIELADAAGRLKAELGGVVVSMNDFSRQTRQSLQELRDGVIESLSEVRDAAAKSLSETAEAARSVITESGSDATARSKRFATATEKVVGSIEKHASTLANIEAASERLASTLTALEQASTATRTTMQELTSVAGQLGTSQGDLHSVSGDLRAAASEMLRHVQSFDASVGRLDQGIAARLDQALAAPSEIATKARADFEEALQRVRASMDELAAAQSDLTSRLVERADEHVALAARHNQALETELAKSRDYVGQVHGSLVEMTGRLADQLEAQAAR